MLSTPHLLVGAAIAKAIPNPIISLPAAFASHFLFDALPHWDGSPQTPFNKKFYFLVSLDYLFGLSMVWWFSKDNPTQIWILLGAFSATLPDFMMGTFRNFNLPWNKWFWYIKLNNFHRRIQNNIPFAAGMATAFITIAVSILILVSFSLG